jgi:VIT1/CCC1 family predicted Fe2+/Mn2+ transporter
MATTTGSSSGSRNARRWRILLSARQSGLLREAIFGINDGLVATVGLVSGEVLSHQGQGAVLVAALSAMGANTVSMAIGSYLASASELALHERLITEQARDIRQDPSGEAVAVRRMLRDLGIAEERLEPVTRDITRSRRRWLKFLVREELGLHEGQRENPLANALTMAGAVVVGSLPPILPFILALPGLGARNWAWGLSLTAAFALGYGRGRITATSPWVSGLQFALLASASAAVGAGIGYVLGLLHW